MFSPKRVLLKSLKIWSSFPLWGIKIRKVEGGGEKKGSSHQTCPLFCLSTYSGRELTTSKDVDFVVNQPCLIPPHSFLKPGLPSGIRVQRLCSVLCIRLPHPFLMACLQYLNASLPEQLLGQVKHPELLQLFFTDHRSYAHVIRGALLGKHTGTL